MPDLLTSWTAVLGPSAEARDVWAELVQRWSEPHRRYHGLAHLVAVLDVVDAHAELAADPDAVRLAAWFHDAVYDATRGDNEERSAVLAADRLGGLGRTDADEVARLVRVTTTHEYADGDPNATLLCDADLAVLAGPPTAYVAYADAVREEYAHVPDDAFRTGRAAVLRSLLGRPRLYGLLPDLEEPARRNLAAELARLGS